MEKRINKSIETYVVEFKNNIRRKIDELQIEDKKKVNELLEYVYDYQRLAMSKDDFIKRKRIQNSIPVSNRCNARRANNEQCTRRRKNGSEYCGTHFKGTPHGTIQRDDSDLASSGVIQKVDVFAEEIMGIVYYVDKSNNVYKTEDIIEGKQNPRIVAKYVKDGAKYKIPEFGLV